MGATVFFFLVSRTSVESAICIRKPTIPYEEQKVADAGCKVLQEVDSGDDLPEDDSLVFPDCVVLNGRCCSK